MAPVENASSLVVLAIVMAVVELVAGGAIGWGLHGNQKGAPPKTGWRPQDVQRARTAFSNLHELATRVAANVGEHSSRVQAISNELTNHGEDGPLESTV